MALALYRKYRPASFAEVVGQEHVTEPLAQAVASGRINHAYLFSGPRGCGKTSSARILARSLNCEQGPTATPCGECDSCRDLAPNGPGNVDVIEIDAASHGGVDDARDLRERAFQMPVRSRYKVYIVDEAHMVTTQGFNALLKVVEEPPESVIFIFATTEPDKVLSTIRSRTHHYPFRLVPPATMRVLLERICSAEGVTVEPAVLPLVVRAGGGSVRDSKSLLDQLLAGAGPDGITYARSVALLGVTDAALLDEIVDALGAGDGAAVFGAVERVADAGHDPRRFATDLLERLRDLIIVDAVPDAVSKGLLDYPADQLERMVDQAARLGSATLSRLADIVHNGLVEMRGTTAPRLLLELMCARMLLPATASGSSALLQRLERLERRLEISAEPSAPDAGAAAPAVDATSVRQVLAQRGSASGSAPERAGAERAGPERAGPEAADPEPSAPSDPAATWVDAPQAPAGAPPAGAPPDGQPPAPGPANAAADEASTQPPASGPGGVDASDVRRLWPQLLELVKQRKRRTHALLMNATAASVDRGVLTLAVAHPPLMKMLSDEANTDVLREALQELLGVDWRIHTVVGDDQGGGAGGTGGSGGAAGSTAAPGPVGGPPPPPPPPEPDPRDEPVQFADGAAQGPTSHQEVSPEARQPPARDPDSDAIGLLRTHLGARSLD